MVESFGGGEERKGCVFWEEQLTLNNLHKIMKCRLLQFFISSKS